MTGAESPPPRNSSLTQAGAGRRRDGPSASRQGLRLPGSGTASRSRKAVFSLVALRVLSAYVSHELTRIPPSYNVIQSIVDVLAAV